MSAALGIVVLAGGLAAGCGGGEPQQNAGNGTTSPVPGVSSLTGDVEITFGSQPDPPRAGDNTFEATVTSGGQPVTDADVSVEFFMPPMPSMNMPEMRNTVALAHEGGGRYRGAGNVMMAGGWNVTVRARRAGQEIGTRKLAVTAR